MVGLKHATKVELYGFIYWECANCKLEKTFPGWLLKIWNYIQIHGCFVNKSLVGGKDKTDRFLRIMHFHHTLNWKS